MEEEIFELTEDIDTLYDQLEMIRVSGCVNMMKFSDVMQMAEDEGFVELKNTILKGEYYKLLSNYEHLARLNHE